MDRERELPGGRIIEKGEDSDGRLGGWLSLPWWEMGGRIIVAAYLSIYGVVGTSFIWRNLLEAGHGGGWNWPGLVAAMLGLIIFVSGVLAATGRMAMATAITCLNLVVVAVIPAVLSMTPREQNALARFPRPGRLEYLWGLSLDAAILLWLIARSSSRGTRGRALLQASCVVLMLVFVARVPIVAASWGEQVGRGLAPLPPRSESVERGQRVPRIAFADPRGERERLNQPGTLYVVAFWASWCGPCRREMPDLLAMARQYSAGGRVKVMAVDTEDLRADELVAQAASMGIGQTEVYSDPANWYEVLGLRTIPLTLVIRDGEVIYRSNGYDSRSVDRIEKVIRETLNVR